MYRYKPIAGNAEYLTSVVLSASTLQKEEFVFYVPTQDGKLMYTAYIDLEERILPCHKIVSERRLMDFNSYLGKVQSKTHVNVRLLARKYATLDEITDNTQREGVYLICENDSCKYRESPIFDYQKAFAIGAKSTQLSYNLHTLYVNEGPAFTVDTCKLVTVLEKLPDSHERRRLYRNIKKYPEVFR